MAEKIRFLEEKKGWFVSLWIGFDFHMFLIINIDLRLWSWGLLIDQYNMLSQIFFV